MISNIIKSLSFREDYLTYEKGKYNSVKYYLLIIKELLDYSLNYNKTKMICPYCKESLRLRSSVFNYYCSYFKSCIINCSFVYNDNKTINAKYCLNCNSIFLLNNREIYIIKRIICRLGSFEGFPCFETINSVSELSINSFINEITFMALKKYNNTNEIVISNIKLFEYNANLISGILV